MVEVSYHLAGPAALYSMVLAIDIDDYGDDSWRCIERQYHVHAVGCRSVTMNGGDVKKQSKKAKMCMWVSQVEYSTHRIRTWRFCAEEEEEEDDSDGGGSKNMTTLK